MEHKLVYQLRYLVRFKDGTTVAPATEHGMEKYFDTWEHANDYQLAYNDRFKDRKIVRYSINVWEVFGEMPDRDPNIDQLSVPPTSEEEALRMEPKK